MITDHPEHEEEEKIKALKELVDSTARKLMWGGLGREKAQELIEKTRYYALQIFPDKAQTYDLIYGARLSRLVEQFLLLKNPENSRSVK